MRDLFCNPCSGRRTKFACATADLGYSSLQSTISPSSSNRQGLSKTLVARGVGSSGPDDAALAGFAIADLSSDARGAFAGFPSVEYVCPASPADCAGIARGSAILEVDGASMQKKEADDVRTAISNALERAPKRAQATLVMALRTPLCLASTPPTLTTPTSSEDRNDSEQPPRPRGGMTCLGRELHRHAEFVEMCWSVWTYPEGGLPPPKVAGGWQMAAAGERPAEEEEEVASRLGFDVERREVSIAMECIEVSAVTPGGLSWQHGLRRGDLILATNGQHLLSCSESSFWLDVGKHLRKCDFARETQQQRQRNEGTEVSPFPIDIETLPDAWLRFLIIRKRSSPATAPAERRPGAGATAATMPGEEGVAGDMWPKNGMDWLARCPQEQQRRHQQQQQQQQAQGDKQSKRRQQPHQHQRQRQQQQQQHLRATQAASGGAAFSPGGPVPKAARAADDVRSRRSPPPLATTGTDGGSGTNSSNTSSSVQRDERAEVRRKREARKRPAWWLPQEKGTHRCVLTLRSADALPGASRGVPTPPGAFLLEDAKLGDAMTVPAGSKLVSVDGKPTGDLPFERARQVALSGGKDTVLVFE